MGLLLQSAWGPLALGGPQTEQTFRRDRDRRRSTQLPLQSYAPNMAPLTPPAAPSLTPLAAAPDKQALAPAQGGGFLDRLAGLPENSLFQMGMSFLGNAQNGGNWAGALQSMQDASRAQLERQRMQNEMRRGKVTEQREGDVYSRQQQEWRRQDERRQSMDAWLGTLSPEQQAAARANPEAAHEAFMEAQAAANAPITPYQREQLALARRGQDMDFVTSQAAQEMRQRSLSLRGPDRDLMETIRNSSGSANELLSMAQMFREANSRTGTGGLTEYLPFNGFSGDRASMRQLESMMRGMMRPVGSGATSDYEQRLYAQGAPRVDMLGPQNEQVIRNIETLARIRNARRYFYEDYADSTGTLNGAERAFQQSEAFRRLQEENPIERPQQQRQRQGRSVQDMSDDELERLARGAR